MGRASDNNHDLIHAQTPTVSEFDSSNNHHWTSFTYHTQASPQQGISTKNFSNSYQVCQNFYVNDTDYNSKFSTLDATNYSYTADLLAIENHTPTIPQSIPAILTSITTPLIKQQWEAVLGDCPDDGLREFILRGISNGFRVGFDYSHHRVATGASTVNMPSTSYNPEPVQKFLTTEVATGRVIGPLCPEEYPQVHVSRFGVIPKKGHQNKWRLILDLSPPQGNSVNDGIDPDICSIKYANVDKAAARMAQLGKGALMDIAHAYRNVPVHPEDRLLLGMIWQGKLYVDTVLPFGLRSAPKIFSAIADTLEWILVKAGVTHCVHYLDDYLTLGSPHSEECEENLKLITQMCKQLGLPLALEKVDGPTQCLTFLGITLDTVRLEIRLPQDKLQELKSLISRWLSRKKAQKRELLSLVGHLAHAAKVVTPGRTFIRRILDVAHSKGQLHHWMYLNSAFRSDLLWWHTFLDQWHGVSCIKTHVLAPPDFVMLSDASGSWGCGAICGSDWLQCEWNGVWGGESIALKELLPIVLATAVWGQKWARSNVLARCDNMAVVEIIKAHTSKSPSIMHLLRCLHFFTAKWDIRLEVEHIPGASNTVADAISRNLMQLF